MVSKLAILHSAFSVKNYYYSEFVYFSQIFIPIHGNAALRDKKMLASVYGFNELVLVINYFFHKE